MFAKLVTLPRSIKLSLLAMVVLACDPTQFVAIGTDAGGAAEDPGSGATSAMGGQTPVAQGGSTSRATTAAGGTTVSTLTTGTTAAGGSTSSTDGYVFEDGPPCGWTLAGVPVTKNVACTADDVQVCYKTCGPNSIGFKPETCTDGLYTELSNTCFYPDGRDYSCYSVPQTLPDAATCGLTNTPPQTSTACTAPACTLCQQNGTYLDSGGALKIGYCVCTEKTDGSSAWSCGSITTWPCPGSEGCKIKPT